MGQEPQTQTTIVDEHGEWTFTEPDFVPIEIAWWGYARAKIWEINADDDPKANRVRATLERDDNKAIIESAEEASALAWELAIADWSWIDHSARKSIDRVLDVVFEEMAKRGYHPVDTGHSYRFKEFEYTGEVVEPEPEPEPAEPAPPEPGSHAWRRARREEADMDALLTLCKEHGRQACADVWPGGTVDVDDIHWFWNTRLSNSAGYCYWNCIPEHAGNGSSRGVAIGLAPAYYHDRGLAELLETVRHELIHAWEAFHPDADGIGHGRQFKQWIGDMNTHRHCKHWSK